MKKIIRKILKESSGISKPVRDWSKKMYEILLQTPKTERRVIIAGEDYPELFENFSFDYAVIDFNDFSNGYLTKTSGYDKDGYYVVHIMILNSFKQHSYLRTILNHELKHAYQDWQRQSKGYPGIEKTKENINIYTEDFMNILKDRINTNYFFKKIFKNYYLLTNLESDAFLENVYDNDKLNPYKEMVTRIKNDDIIKDLNYMDIETLEEDWQKLLTLDLPFIKKYKNYQDFIEKSVKFFKKKSTEILRRINKMEYIHRDRDLNENLLKEQMACHLISPRGKGKGGYMSNQEALDMINKIQIQGRKEIHDPETLSKFVETVSDFRQSIKNIDTNNDTIDTYLHKLRELLKCYDIDSGIDAQGKDFVF